jgi:hypothetical protein
LSNRFSIKAKDLEDLLLQISLKTQNSLEALESIEEELIHNVGSLQSVNSIARILGNLSKELEVLKFKTKFRLFFIDLVVRIELWMSTGKAELGFLLKRYNKPGKINFNNLGYAKRPEIQIEKIKADVERICQTLNIKNNFLIEKRYGNTFSVKKL